MPCCSCNGKRALCKGCTCAKGKKVCIDCYPGRKGKCANASIRPTASQTSSQPLLPILTPSCSSAQASQPSLQEIHLPSTRPSPTVEYYSSPHSPQPLRSSPQPAAGPPHIPPLSPPTASIRSCIRNRTPTSSPPPGHRSTKHPALRDPQETQPMFPASNPQSPPSSPASLQSSLTSRPQFPLVPPTIESLPRQPPSPPTSPEQLPGPSSRASSRVSNIPTKGQRVYSQPPVSTCSHQTTRPRRKQQCIVEGCPELIAPSMWKAHMTLHAQEVFPGDVPISWLEENDLYICRNCVQLVSNSRLAHIPKNVLGAAAARGSDIPVDNPPVEATPPHQPEPSLPTFEEVCLLNQPTLSFIPSGSRPAFARALSSALRGVFHDSSEDAWLKLFMLPKCVLPSSGHRRKHGRPPPVDTLCNMWIENDLAALWNMAKTRTASHNGGKHGSLRKDRTNVINQAVSLGRSGMMGKACRILQSNGIAPIWRNQRTRKLRFVNFWISFRGTFHRECMAFLLT